MQYDLPTYPGAALRTGSAGSEVARVQKYLSALAALSEPLLSARVDGRYGADTRRAVRAFQTQQGLAADGEVGPVTWAALMEAYGRAFGGGADTNPGVTLRAGARGQDVRQMQRHLNTIASVYTGVGSASADGRFGDATAGQVRRFQRQFGLAADGVIGPATWAAITRVAAALKQGQRPHVFTPYPGTLREGSSGDAVRFLQSYLNRLHGTPLLAVDGRFGAATKQAVKGFQTNSGLTADGIVGRATWEKLIPLYNAANV